MLNVIFCLSYESAFPQLTETRTDVRQDIHKNVHSSLQNTEYTKIGNTNITSVNKGVVI